MYDLIFKKSFMNFIESYYTKSIRNVHIDKDTGKCKHSETQKYFLQRREPKPSSVSCKKLTVPRASIAPFYVETVP